MVNITKFGAFVNVLPGRDGLLHISKLSSLAGGKRINNVEDVLTLGQPVEVRVDDIDPQGKVSLSLAVGARGRRREPSATVGSGGRRRAAGTRRTGTAPASPCRARLVGVRPADVDGPSFEDAFEAELVADLGDLGPGAAEGRDERPR